MLLSLIKGRNRRRAGSLSLLLCGAFALGGCDLVVSSPSLAEEGDADRPAAVLGLLRGVEGNIVYTMINAGTGGSVFAGALLTDELVYSGHLPGQAAMSIGEAQDDSQEVEELWAGASQARWTAENLVDRIKRLQVRHAEDDEDVLVTMRQQLARANLWAGFANRIMGDTFCEAVVDIGPLEPHTRFYERAEKYFADAIVSAEDAGLDATLAAAYGGRAQVRMMLGDWDGAVEDAGKVETAQLFEAAQGFFTGRDREWNWMYRYSSSNEFRFGTVWGTPFEQWGLHPTVNAAGDPRVEWTRPASPNNYGSDGRRRFYRQLKWASSNADVPMTRGTEMRLIEAEALLLDGQVQPAVDKINAVRTHRSVPTVAAATEDAAWDLLMRERALELYLEGRRLPDLRRWAKVPGNVNSQVVRRPGPGAQSTDEIKPVLDVPAMCLPVSRREKTANPNING